MRDLNNTKKLWLTAGISLLLTTGVIFPFFLAYQLTGIEFFVTMGELYSYIMEFLFFVALVGALGGIKEETALLVCRKVVSLLYPPSL